MLQSALIFFFLTIFVNFRISCHKSFDGVADKSHINIEWSREDKKKDMQELEEVRSPNKVGERLHKNSGKCSISSYVTLW